MESIVGDIFERLTAADSNIKTLQAQSKMLLDQLDDLENLSTRNNLRILNIPEGSEHGKDLLKFMSELLTEAFGPEVFPTPPDLERAHWNPTLRSSQRTSPHAFLACFTKFQEKEAGLRWARTHDVKYQGTTLTIYQDISTTLAKNRVAFNSVKQALYKKNVKFKV